MTKFKLIQYDNRGVSHILALLLVVLVLAIGGTYALVSSKADQVATSSSNRAYYYQPLSNAQANKIKKVASQYWGGICNNGKNLKLDYYWGPLRVPDIANPDDKGVSTDLVLDLDAVAFVRVPAAKNPRSPEYCRIHVNATTFKALMDKGQKYSTKRAACFVFTHEVGHIVGWPDYDFGQQVSARRDAKKYDERGLIMSYDYSWNAVNGRKSSRTVGPAYCHKIR